MSEARKPIPNLDPIFEACCGDNTGRYLLSQPFIRAGFVAATDGRIAVRQETKSKRHDKNRPAVNSLFDANKHEKNSTLLSLPDHLRGHDDEGRVVLRDEPGEFAVKAEYVRLLLRHGVKEVFLPIPSQALRACYFTKGKIEGLLMPSIARGW